VSARPHEATEGTRPVLKVIDGGESPAAREERQVVAEILNDGTVRLVAAPNGRNGDRGYATGQVAGDGWTVWWDRRYWE
jgi:hypothetical protein